MEGWIKIHHRFLDWKWFKEDGMVNMFVNLLLRANFEDCEYNSITIHRGQLITGRKQLMEETGLTEQTVRTCLKRLQYTGEINIESTHRYSIITIVNYEVYQNKLTNQKRKSNHPANQLINQVTNQLKKIANDYISNNYGGDKACANQLINQLINQVTNQLISKNQPTEQESVPHTPNKENTKEYKENSTKVESKKDELSLSHPQELLEKRSRKFYDDLIPFVEVYGKEMIRAFYNYWTEPNKSKTKMRFELEKTWDVKRRLNTWVSREKINQNGNGTEIKQQQQEQRAREIEKLNKMLRQKSGE